MYYNASHDAPPYHPGGLTTTDATDEISPADPSHLPPHPSSTDAAEVGKICRTMSRSAGDTRSSSLASTGSDYSSLAQLDLDKFLKTSQAQRESRGVPPRRLGVRFEGVTTWGAAPEEAEGVKTFAGAVKRTLMGRDLYEWVVEPWFRGGKRDRTPRRALIQNVSGLVRDGEMMLVLGRPGSGCSTFLRTITSNHSSYLGVDGRITYSGGLTPKDIQTRYRGDVAYMPEEDLHLPYLTVRQTLEFAFRCKQPDPRLVETSISTLARVFGISHVLDTIVGDEHVRGISGGERKRLSCIETLATDAVVVAWDGSTRGLDAAATLDYARSLRILTDVARKATIVSLYQASEEVWELMDKLTLLAEGRVIFSGPIAEAKRYFVEDLGYECGERRTTADFLTSVTNPGERRFRPGWEGRAPKGAVELEQAFIASRHYKALMAEVATSGREFGDDDSTHDEGGGKESSTPLSTFQTATQAQKARYVRPQSAYTIPFPQQVSLCLTRQLHHLRNTTASLAIRLINTVVNALVMGSLFWAQPATSAGAFSRGGFIFYTAVFLGWIQLAELGEAFSGRGVVERQRGFAFVRPSAVAVARMVVDLGVVFVQAGVFAGIVYWMAGMKRDLGAFATFLGFVYLLTVGLTALYRVFAALAGSYEVAVRYCGVTILVYIVFGGYTLPVDTMMRDAPWFGWIAYLNPVYYAFAALMATEFHNLSLECTGDSVIPSGPGYTDPRYQTCALAGSVPLQLTVLGDDYVLQSFGYKYSDVWANFGIVLAMAVGLYIAGAVASEWVHWGGTAAEGVVFRTGGKKRKGGGDVEGGSRGRGHVGSDGDGGVQAGTPSVELQKSTATFTWKELDYSIPTKDGKGRKLLNNVEGICRPGEMTALIGASGAGKTTLLTVLSQRTTSGTATGTISINGSPLPPSFARSTGVCAQTDLHDPTSTVLEAFQFSALLRQPLAVPRAEKLAYVSTVLHLLDLHPLRDALIGSLALEQKKRTTIGVELCARPSLLLFLDEPTSGLDSQGAYNIVRLLRRLVDEGGQSVLCTIHQASQQILEMFDGVLALNPGGETFYCGPVGEGGRGVIGYFERRGVRVREGKNVADLLIELGRGGEGGVMDWNSIWRDSSERRALLEEISAVKPPPTDDANPTTSTPPTTEYATSLLTQTHHLLLRLTRHFWRTPEYPYSRLFASLLHASLIGFTFFRASPPPSAPFTLSSLQPLAFATFLILMLVPEFVNAVTYRFTLSTALLTARDLPARAVSPGAFALANILAELPYVVLNTLVYFPLWYLPIGFPLRGDGGEGAAGYMLLMLGTFIAFATSWGQWIAALAGGGAGAGGYAVAAGLVPFFVIMCESFNGILRPYSQLPGFWRRGMYLVNPMTYFVRGVLAATLGGGVGGQGGGGRQVICAPGEENIFHAPPGQTCGAYAAAWFARGAAGGYLVNPGDTGGEGGSGCGYCRYRSTGEFLGTLNVSVYEEGQGGGGKWRDWAVFAGFVVGNWMLVGVFVVGGRGGGGRGCGGG